MSSSQINLLVGSMVHGPWSVVCGLSSFPILRLNFYHEAFAAEPGIVYNQQEAIH